MRVMIVLDDTVKTSEVLEDVIGNRTYSEIVIKRQSLKERFTKIIAKIFPDCVLKSITSAYQFEELISTIEKKYSNDTRVLHFLANNYITDEENITLTLSKLAYVDDVYCLMPDGEDSRAVGVMCPDLTSYCKFVEKIQKSEKHQSREIMESLESSIPIEGTVDISVMENFIQCIGGSFDARFFNQLKGDEYTVTKTSTNKSKIKSEYSFYHLLPEDMQFWFVEPFNYRETEDSASYTMERLHMTDLAIKWINGSIDDKEFSRILDKYFYFFSSRHARRISNEEYTEISEKLYSEKVKNRIEDLKKIPVYQSINNLLNINNGKSLDDILSRYFKLKNKIECSVDQEPISVIGHGDPCFANAMYNKTTMTLKFIDPKGALTEDELWTNPFYDIAKLSHSICGRYDFLNNNLFDISVGEQLEADLHIDFDNSKHIEMFRKKLEKEGYNYFLIRLYEVSLFLSMLPLHIDNPRKVYGFILNADNIMEEIEKNV